MIEATALVVALAALLISGLSLYLSSLKSAEIEVDHVSSQLDGSTFSGELPQGNAARFTVFVSNGGARGGLLHKIWVDSLEWLGEGEPFWADLHQTNIFREVALMTPLLLPAAYEAGDAETATLVVTLIPAPVDVEELAARLGEMDGIALTIHWTFLRTNGLPVAWKFLPKKWKRSRELVQRSTRVVFDTEGYRTSVITFWRRPQFERLAAIAERTPH